MRLKHSPFLPLSNLGLFLVCSVLYEAQQASSLFLPSGFFDLLIKIASSSLCSLLSQLFPEISSAKNLLMEQKLKINWSPIIPSILIRTLVLKMDPKVLSTVSIGWRGDTGFSIVGVRLGSLHYRHLVKKLSHILEGTNFIRLKYSVWVRVTRLCHLLVTERARAKKTVALFISGETAFVAYWGCDPLAC